LTIRNGSYNLFSDGKSKLIERDIDMAKQKTQQPTGRELQILRILWNEGPGTVRKVNEEMNKHQKTGYTTTLKLMQIMTGKGLVVRDDSKFQHVYRPAVSEEKTQKLVVGDLLEKVFSGSAEKLVMRALSAKEVSAKELAKIRKMLDEMEGK
jgi:predicted transcriptional regulator